MEYRLTDLARKELDALAADGITPDPQEVLGIQRLSLDCEKPDAALGSLARGRPVLLGSETVWPATIAAATFFEEVSPLAREDKERFFILVYACRFGRDASRIYERGEEAVRNVRAWKGRLRCTPAEVVEAFEKLTADSLPDTGEIDEEAWHDFVADLALRATALCGGTPEEWETHCSIPAVARIVDLVYNQKAATGGSAKNDPRIAATRRLGKYLLALRKKREAGNG